MTKQMISPLGKRVHFEWIWSGGAALLRTIKDENGVIISQWDYQGVALLNKLMPGTTATVSSSVNRTLLIIISICEYYEA